METIIGTFYKDRVVLVLFWLLYFPILTSSNIAYLSGWKSVVRTPGPGTLDSWNWSVLAGLRPGPGRLRGIEAQFYILPLSPAARPSSRPRPAPPGPAAPPLSGARQSEAGRGGEQSSTAAVCRDNTAVSRVRTGARTQWQIAVWPGHLPAPAPCPAPSCEQHRCAGLVSSADPGPSTRPRLSVVSSCLAFVWSPPPASPRHSSSLPSSCQASASPPGGLARPQFPARGIKPEITSYISHVNGTWAWAGFPDITSHTIANICMFQISAVPVLGGVWRGKPAKMNLIQLQSPGPGHTVPAAHQPTEHLK